MRIAFMMLIVATAAYGQNNTITLSAHLAVPGKYLGYYSKEGPGITARYGYRFADRWMAVGLAGLHEFHPRHYADNATVTELDAKIFPVQGGVRFFVVKDRSRPQPYVSAFSGAQIVRLEDPVLVKRDTRWTAVSLATELGCRTGNLDFNVYWNWMSVASRFQSPRYMALGIGYSLN